MRRYGADFQRFAQMMKQSPMLLNQLLRQVGMTPTADLCGQLRAYYGKVYADYEAEPWNRELSPGKMAAWSDAAGLAVADSELPLSLYRAYCTNIEQEYARHESYSFSEEELVFLLTCGGIFPLENIFVVPFQVGPHQRLLIYGWDGRSGGDQVLSTEIDMVNEACHQYLLSRGAVLDSLDQMYEQAVREGWPHADKAAKARSDAIRARSGHTEAGPGS